MKGKHEVLVRNARVQYKFTVTGGNAYVYPETLRYSPSLL